MKVSHKGFNRLLTIIVILGALYIVVAPYWPGLLWRFKDKSVGAPYAGELRGETAIASDVEPTPIINRIVIPSALIDLPILEGKGVWVINDGGSWRKNLYASSPFETGNTVIVAHRFTYKRPDSGFYHLDKVHVGDRLAIYWDGKELLYKVTETKTVPATAIDVESNTTDRTLTLYTCTPIITGENRLVVVAKPEVSEGEQ